MSYLIGAAHYLQIKASDDVILQHTCITLSQFYTTVKICYAFSVCSYVKKFQNFKSDKNILLTVCSNHILAFSLYMGGLLFFQNFHYINHCNVISYFMTSKCA